MCLRFTGKNDRKNSNLVLPTDSNRLRTRKAECRYRTDYASKIFSIETTVPAGSRIYTTIHSTNPVNSVHRSRVQLDCPLHNFCRWSLISNQREACYILVIFEPQNMRVWLHTAGLDVQYKPRKNNLLANQKGYDNPEATVGKLLAMRIQFCLVYFCKIYFWPLFSK